MGIESNNKLYFLNYECLKRYKILLLTCKNGIMEAICIKMEDIMTIDTENLLNSILESLEQIDYIKTSDIPNIDLYMDQVTTFMDNNLRKFMRNPEDNKILTKTMINNYAKNDLMPPPIKKKYSKEHVLLLIFIYYYKGILSINDIQTLLHPITEHFFQNGKEFNLEAIYNEVFGMEKEQLETLKKDVIEKFQRSEETFQEAPKENQDFLKKFSFICLLSFDVYMKKLIIENLIDELGKAGYGASKMEHTDKTKK